MLLGCSGRARHRGGRWRLAGQRLVLWCLPASRDVLCMVRDKLRNLVFSYVIPTTPGQSVLTVTWKFDQTLELTLEF